MGYVPPRGQCNFKQSLMSPRCPCLRFMLHPLKVKSHLFHVASNTDQSKSSSSYECDGCGHHASFHSMENRSDDEIRKKWEQEAKERAEREAEVAQRPKKRPRAIEYRNDADDTLNVEPTYKSRSSLETAGGAAKPQRAAGTRAKRRISRYTDEEEEIVELD